MKNRENFTDLTEMELQEKFRHFKEELFNLRFQVVTGQLSNHSRISLVRKNIARVQTRINQMKKEKILESLKDEYNALIKSRGIDPKLVPLNEKISMLKSELSEKAQKVKLEIKNQVDGKVLELVKAIRAKISEKLKEYRGKKGEKGEEEWRKSSKRLADPRSIVRKKFLDKLTAMGLNEASQIKSLRETKRQKLEELEKIQSLQKELTAGRLPF